MRGHRCDVRVLCFLARPFHVVFHEKWGLQVQQRCQCACGGYSVASYLLCLLFSALLPEMQVALIAPAVLLGRSTLFVY